jgi:hypothetical protein
LENDWGKSILPVLDGEAVKNVFGRRDGFVGRRWKEKVLSSGVRGLNSLNEDRRFQAELFLEMTGK